MAAFFALLFPVLILIIFLQTTAILVRSNIIIKNQEDASVNSVENDVKQLEKFLEMGVISESEYHEKLKLLKDYYENK